MRAVGRWSLSSFLSGVLTVASVAVAIAVAIATFILVTSPWIDLGGNGRLSIPVALQIDEQALHVGAPSLGPGAANLSKVTGTLEFTAPSRQSLIAPMTTLIVMLLFAGWALHSSASSFAHCAAAGSSRRRTSVTCNAWAGR